MAERRKKAPKMRRKTGKGENFLQKTGEEKCAGNRKMTFLSHEKPENLKIFAENGKLILKTAETGKLFQKAAESTQKTMKGGGNLENRKKATELKPEKHEIFHVKPETDPL